MSPGRDVDALAFWATEIFLLMCCVNNNVLAERIVPNNIWRSRCSNHMYSVTQSIAKGLNFQRVTSIWFKTELSTAPGAAAPSKLATYAIAKSAKQPASPCPVPKAGAQELNLPPEL